MSSDDPSPADPRPTRRLVVDPTAPDPAHIAEAAAVLRAGGLVALPTETVYGLGALISDVGALAGVFTAKGRPHSDPLIVHLADTADLPTVADPVGPAEELAARFWPGPLSLVLPRHASVPDLVTAGTDTVAVRVPAHAVARMLIREAGAPVAAPSANRFGRISPTSAQHVLDELDGRIDLVIDAGCTRVGVESTVVSLLGPTPVLLRPGAVTVEELLEVVPDLVVTERDVEERPSAPGRLLRHYAPSTPAVLLDGPGGSVRDLLGALRRLGISAALVAPDGMGADHPLGSDGAAAAERLYGALRAADASGAEVVLLVAPAPAGIGRAVADRMWRAAEGRVLDLNDPGDAVERVRGVIRSR